MTTQFVTLNLTKEPYEGLTKSHASWLARPVCRTGRLTMKIPDLPFKQISPFSLVADKGEKKIKDRPSNTHANRAMHPASLSPIPLHPQHVGAFATEPHF